MVTLYVAPMVTTFALECLQADKVTVWDINTCVFVLKSLKAICENLLYIFKNGFSFSVKSVVEDVLEQTKEEAVVNEIVSVFLLFKICLH